MNWLWYCHRLVDADLARELTRAQRELVVDSVSARYRRYSTTRGRFWRWVLMAVAWWAAAIAGLFLARRVGGPVTFFMLVAFATVGFVTLTWLSWRRAYAQPTYAALQRLGYDVCMTCGYWLRGLGDDVNECPECGAAREAMPPEHVE